MTHPAARFARLSALVLVAPLAACVAGADGSSSEAEALTTCGSALGDQVAAAAEAGASTVSVSLDTRANAIVTGPIVEGRALGDALYDLVSHAKSEVFVQVFDIDDKSWLAQRLHDAIATLPSSVHVYIMANPETGGSGSGVLSIVPETRAHLVSRLQAFYAFPNVTIGAWNTGWDLFNVDHVKSIVVDGSRALVLDANLQPNGDPLGASSGALGWFQLGYVVEGAVASSMRADSIAAWKATYPSQSLPAAPAVPTVNACTRTVLLSRQAGADRTSSADKGYAALLGGAKHTLHVITPNLNDTMALSSLAAATANADVEIVLSQGFNDTTEALPFQGGTNETIVPKLASMAANPCHLHVRWFARTPGVAENGNKAPTSHAKWASADGTAMILGSQNLDTQSWTHSRELSVLVDDAQTTAAFDQVFAGVWANGAKAYECK
jgi:phosphatidylserine/phosphatidylglycerophosphate/cardiolipin synthase-like enzyme